MTSMTRPSSSLREPKSGIKLRILRGRPRRARPPRENAAPISRSRRILLTFGGLLMLVLLAAGHIIYWYMPRLRPASPRPNRLPAQLLASTEFPYAVWLPFPHQNLALLEQVASPESTSSSDDIPRALSRLAGMPAPSLPTFGTFRLPPSREITLATDKTGERFALAAEVYPVVAAFAKLAGRVANNRWLQGGELTVDGRTVQVTWYGRVWTVASPGFPTLDAPSPESPPASPPSLMIAEVRQAKTPFPRGRFHLNRDGDDLVLASAKDVSGVFGLDSSTLPQMGAFLLVISGGRPDRLEPMQAMAFFTRNDPLQFSKGGVSYEFPGMASIYQTQGGERWKLPGETLLKWTGRKVRRLELGGNFEAAGIDKKSLRRIERLVPQFVPLVRTRPEGRLVWGLWLDLQEGQTEVSRIARAMQEIPLVSLEDEQRWRDAATVLTPAVRTFSSLSVVVTEQPSALELRFVGR